MERKLRNETFKERYIVVTGVVGKVSEIRNLAQSSVCTISIGLYNGKTKEGDYKESTWVDFECWDDLASKALSLNKKDRIRIWGNVGHRSWIDKKTNKQVVKLSFSAVGFEPAPYNQV